MIQITKVPERTEQKTGQKTFFFLLFGGVTSLLATSGMLPGNYLQVGLDLLKTPHVGTNAKLAKQGTLLASYLLVGLDLLRNTCHCSVAQLCPTLFSPMNCNTSSSPVLHYLSEFAQAHVH